jgi:steroid delta-isomerase-like uncharacterized protein
MTRDEVVAQVRRGVDAFNAQDLDAIDELYAEDAIMRDLPNPEPARGRDAIRRRDEELFKAFPDGKVEIVDMTIDGNKCCTEWRFEATHEGDFAGVPATHRKVAAMGCNCETFNDERQLVSQTAYWDLGGFLTQVGAMQAPGAAAGAQAPAGTTA